MLMSVSFIDEQTGDKLLIEDVYKLETHRDEIRIFTKHERLAVSTNDFSKAEIHVEKDRSLFS